MTAAEAKKIPLEALLAALGHKPRQTRKGGGDLWYLSPFRPETEPSFHVNVAKNVWFDFGSGSGGDVAAFVMQFFKCPLPTAMKRLENLFPGEKPSVVWEEKQELETTRLPENEAFKLLKTEPLTHPGLIKYLTTERFVRLQTARLFLREIHFENPGTGKKYFAAGLPNMAGGWEIRNPYFKSSVGGKAMSHFPGKLPTLSVFEGMFDFLSAFDYYGAVLTEGHSLVLHSVSFLDNALEFARTGNFSRIYTYFDNDGAGEEASRAFLGAFGERLEPCHGLYFPCKDFNEWMVRRLR